MINVITIKDLKQDIKEIGKHYSYDFDIIHTKNCNNINVCNKQHIIMYIKYTNNYIDIFAGDAMAITFINVITDLINKGYDFELDTMTGIFYLNCEVIDL